MISAPITELLARINTEPLGRPDAPTVALVVFNFGPATVPPCRVRFSAVFPTRSVQPVTVRDERGNIVPSRIVEETITRAPELPDGKFLWSLLLEFAVREGLPPDSARTFGASYESSETDRSELSRLPLRSDIAVCETTCHIGDIPTTFSLSVSYEAV